MSHGSSAGREPSRATSAGFREQQGAFTWVDIERPTHADLDALKERYGFHTLELEDVVSARQRNKLERQGDHLFIILRFPRGGPEAQLRSQISLFLGSDYLVTVHEGELPAVGDVWRACLADPKLLQGAPSFVVYKLLDGLVDGLFPHLDDLTSQLAEIEEAVFDEQTEVIRAVTSLRRKAHYLRTSVLPLKRVIADISTELWGHDRKLIVYLKDVNDHVEKVVEKLEEVRETVEIYKDTDFLLSTYKTNRILAILTIAFTLAIPATLVGTFYGMNVPLPGGLNGGPWTFLGPYTTFLLVVVLSLILPGIVMFLSFRRLKWI